MSTIAPRSVATGIMIISSVMAAMVSAISFGAALRPYLPRLLIASASLLLAGMIVLGFPVLAARATAAVAESGRIPGYILLVLALLIALQGLFSYVGTRLASEASERIVRDLRAFLFDSYLTLHPERWELVSRGDRLARLNNDTNVVGFFLGSTLPNALPQLIAAGGAIAFIVFREPSVALLLLVTCALLLFLLRFAARDMRRASAAALEREGELYSIADESLAALPIIRSFVVEKPAESRFADINRRSYEARREYALKAAMLPPAARTGGALAVLSLLALLFSMSGSATAVTQQTNLELLFFALVAIRPMGTFSSLFTRYVQARAALVRVNRGEWHEEAGGADNSTREGTAPGKRVSAVAPSQLAVTSATLNDAPLASTSGRETEVGNEPAQTTGLSARQIRFAYPDRGPLLRHVDLELRAGETVVITGRNGAGKSTLAYLLLGLMEPADGTLSVDDMTSETMGLATWRRQFGYVPQLPLLQNGTVRWNVLLGREFLGQDNDSALEKALETVQAQRFVDSLPDGVETHLSDGGAGLSGGQQQRLALARAIVGDPRFLILDEPTSMLDRDVIADLIDTSRAWRQERGVLIFTHDHALQAIADRTLELREGILV